MRFCEVMKHRNKKDPLKSKLKGQQDSKEIPNIETTLREEIDMKHSKI